MKTDVVKLNNTIGHLRKTELSTRAKYPLTQAQKIEAAFKELSQKFNEIPEIGKFKPIKVNITNPLPDSEIKKASIVIEPLADKNDFRTRVLTFVAESPFSKDTIHEISPASGNKFSIDSTLRNPKIKTLFKAFIKSAEKTFDL